MGFGCLHPWLHIEIISMAPIMELGLGRISFDSGFTRQIELKIFGLYVVLEPNWNRMVLKQNLEKKMLWFVK